MAGTMSDSEHPTFCSHPCNFPETSENSKGHVDTHTIVSHKIVMSTFLESLSFAGLLKGVTFWEAHMTRN